MFEKYTVFPYCTTIRRGIVHCGYVAVLNWCQDLFPILEIKGRTYSISCTADNSLCGISFPSFSCLYKLESTPFEVQAYPGCFWSHLATFNTLALRNGR